MEELPTRLYTVSSSEIKPRCFLVLMSKEAAQVKNKTHIISLIKARMAEIGTADPTSNPHGQSLGTAEDTLTFINILV